MKGPAPQRDLIITYILSQLKRHYFETRDFIYT
jgi:hypothetical protein